MREIKTCAVCGKVFFLTRPNRIYCTAECRGKAKARRRKGVRCNHERRKADDQTL